MSSQARPPPPCFGLARYGDARCQTVSKNLGNGNEVHGPAQQCRCRADGLRAQIPSLMKSLGPAYSPFTNFGLPWTHAPARRNVHLGRNRNVHARSRRIGHRGIDQLPRGFPGALSPRRIAGRPATTQARTRSDSSVSVSEKRNASLRLIVFSEAMPQSSATGSRSPLLRSADERLS